MRNELETLITSDMSQDSMLGEDMMNSSGAVVLSVVGMKMPCLESQSMTTRRAVWPEEFGRCLMKSMEIEFQGLLGTRSCFKSP